MFLKGGILLNDQRCFFHKFLLPSFWLTSFYNDGAFENASLPIEIWCQDSQRLRVENSPKTRSQPMISKKSFPNKGGHGAVAKGRCRFPVEIPTHFRSHRRNWVFEGNPLWTVRVPQDPCKLCIPLQPTVLGKNSFHFGVWKGYALAYVFFRILLRVRQSYHSRLGIERLREANKAKIVGVSWRKPKENTFGKSFQTKKSSHLSADYFL